MVSVTLRPVGGCLQVRCGFRVSCHAPVGELGCGDVLGGVVEGTW
jgi:hypothetical protein